MLARIVVIEDDVYMREELIDRSFIFPDFSLSAFPDTDDNIPAL